MNLKGWAVTRGVSCSTVLRWHEDGVLPVPTYQVGRLVVIGDGAVSRTCGTTVGYARVSSADQRPDLDRQVSRVPTWATGRRLPVDRVVTEVGSALNGERREFLALLEDPTVTTIVVEHRDRFARFGAEYVRASLEATGRRLLVVDPAEVDDDPVRDVTEILTVLCARLYGRRASADRAARMVECATVPDCPDGAP